MIFCRCELPPWLPTHPELGIHCDRWLLGGERNRSNGPEGQEPYLTRHCRRNQQFRSEHPGKTGETAEIAGLWKSLQPRLFRYTLRHPHFLRALPVYLGTVLRQLFRRPTRKAATLIVEEEVI